jgi:hypothetical protein
MIPFDEDEIEMCSNCFDEEEYDFGLCVACVEEAMEEIRENNLTIRENNLTISVSYGNVIL